MLRQSLPRRCIHEITHVISAIQQGEPQAAEQLVPLVYNELRRLAAEKLSHEKSGQTLQATALVHEAYLRLVRVDEPPHWNNRMHFFAGASEATDDFLMQSTKNTIEVLKKHGFKPVFKETSGGHTWINWRNYVNEFAPMLFQ